MQPVSGEAIAAAIAAAGDSVRVVVLNACFSAPLAQALTEHVDVAVGMNRPVGDRAARIFAQQLYSALGYGHSVGKSFDQAVAALMLEGTGGRGTPELVARDGVDPYELVLVDPKAVRAPDPAADRARLAQRSDEHVAHLGRHARLPLGDGLMIERAVGRVIAQRAEAGPLLVLGAPGSGKSGALHRFVRDARTVGHDVVVLAADLLQASGRRGLSEELGLELDLVDVLATWSGERPAYLVVDALDAARGRESSGVLLDLIERVALRAGRWRVVASVRSFDLRHNPELQGAFPLPGGAPAPADIDPEFAHVRHVLVAGFSDDELAALDHEAPAIAQFLAAAPEPLHELARVPFNLRLVVKLLERPDLDREELRSLRTRLELLDLYWRVRVRRGTGQDARELFATRVCEEALALMRLQVPRRRLRAEAAQGSALVELLDEGVLVEVAAGPRGEESLGFAHNVLFDYAVHALLLAGDPGEVTTTLRANEELVLLARPSQDPLPTTDVGVALDAVARTCATDPEATRALLVRVADPERVPRYGSYELNRVAHELDVVTSCLPDVVERIYAVAYEYDETSEEQTPFGGGQILRLTSTRRQDWQMVRYALGQEYPKVLRTDARVGVRVLVPVCEHEARSWSDAGAEIEVPLGEAAAVIRCDGSHYWDTHVLERNTRSMLGAFEGRLAEAAAAGDSATVAAIFQELGARPQPAAIWRRVLRAAARDSAALAPWLAGPLTSSAFLSVEELLEPVGAFLPEAFEQLGATERQKIEQAIMALAEAYPAERREAAEERRDQLLTPIPPQTLTTEPARARAAELAVSGEAPPPEQPFDFELHREPPGEEEYLRARGIDPDSPANARLLELIKPVEQFAAAALAWQTPLPVRERSVTHARELALAGAHAALPAGEPESLEQFDRGGPSWGMPSGRIDAARALLFLAREPAAVDEEILEAATALAHDPHPAVRWSAAHWLGLARHADEERIWALVEEIAREESSANVLHALLRPIAVFANDRPERALTLAREIYEREAHGHRREALLRAAASLLVEYWVVRGREEGRALVDRWIADIADAAELARSAFFTLREVVTRGGDGADDTMLRERAIGVFADLARAAGDEFQALTARRRAGELGEQDQDTLRAVAELLDSAASELYFASGSYAETQKQEDERLAPDVRERFYREGAPIIQVLTGIGLPSVAHDVLQTLAGFVGLDPRGVLLQLGRLLEAGKSWGYQLESLAEGEFVRLVELYLASHRDLLMRDPQARAVLVASLESFLDAGWPSARRLLYGLDDMFR